MPSHAPGPAGNGGNVNKPAVRLTRILSAGLMTSSSRQGGRDDDYFFTFISFPLFLCPSLWAPACLPSRPVRLSPAHPVLGVLSLPFLSVLRTGEEYHVRRASRRQRSCKKRANGNASVVASRPPRRHTRARRGGFRRAESRRECCELQISIFTSVPKPFTLPFWSFIFNRAHSLHPIKRAN